MEKYVKDGITFYKCISTIGHKFLVASKNGYDMIGETEQEIIEKYERLGV